MNKYSFNEKFFDVIDTEERAYWLGFLMADGCVSINKKKAMYRISVRLHSKDTVHLNKWHSSIQSNKTPVVHNIEYVISQHYSKHMCESLIKLGCCERKTLNLVFPKIEHNLLNHFVRGYFDGDGSIGVYKNKICISFVGMKAFLDKISFIFSEYSDAIPTKSKTIYQLRFNGNRLAMTVADWLYDNATIFLDRKYQIYKNHRNTLGV